MTPGSETVCGGRYWRRRRCDTSGSTTLDYTAVGDTVTVASHLLEAAESGIILIGEATYRMVESLIRVEIVEPFAVRGGGRAVVAHRPRPPPPPGPPTERASRRPGGGKHHDGF